MHKHSSLLCILRSLWWKTRFTELQMIATILNVPLLLSGTANAVQLLFVRSVHYLPIKICHFGCRSNVVVGIQCLKSQLCYKNKGIFLLSFQTTIRWFQIDLPTANLFPRRWFIPTQPQALNVTKYIFFCHDVCSSTHTIAPLSQKNALACQRHHPSSWSVSPSFSAPNHSSKCYHFISGLEK